MICGFTESSRNVLSNVKSKLLKKKSPMKDIYNLDFTAIKSQSSQSCSVQTIARCFRITLTILTSQKFCRERQSRHFHCFTTVICIMSPRDQNVQETFNENPLSHYWSVGRVYSIALCSRSGTFWFLYLDQLDQSVSSFSLVSRGAFGWVPRFISITLDYCTHNSFIIFKLHKIRNAERNGENPNQYGIHGKFFHALACV